MCYTIIYLFQHNIHLTIKMMMEIGIQNCSKLYSSRVIHNIWILSIVLLCCLDLISSADIICGSEVEPVGNDKAFIYIFID